MSSGCRVKPGMTEWIAPPDLWAFDWYMEGLGGILRDVRDGGGEDEMSKHTCLYYESRENLLEFIVPFFEQGLRLNELCVWIVPESMGTEGAKVVLGERIKNWDAWIEKAQFELADHKDFYGGSGAFNKNMPLENIAQKEEYALKQGFSGLRGSGDLSWLQEKDRGEFFAYERDLDELISRKKMMALCTFPVGKFDASEIFTLNLSHGISVRKKDGEMNILADNTSMFPRGWRQDKR
jgi:hypothetical protein